MLFCTSVPVRLVIESCLLVLPRERADLVSVGCESPPDSGWNTVTPHFPTPGRLVAIYRESVSQI